MRSDFRDLSKLLSGKPATANVKRWTQHGEKNGRLERFHATIKGGCIRLGVALFLGDA